MSDVVKQAVIYCEAELDEAVTQAKAGKNVLIMRFCQGCGTVMYGNPLTRRLWIDRCELCEKSGKISRQS